MSTGILVARLAAGMVAFGHDGWNLMRYRVWAVGGAAVALVAAVAGCSGGQATQQGGAPGSVPRHAAAPASGSGSSANAVQAAYQTTVAARTAKVEMKTVINAKGRSVTLDAHGVTDFARKTGQFTMTLPGGAGTLETRYLNGHAYEKLPPQLAQRLGATTPWISFDVNALAEQTLGAGVSQLSQGTPQNPSAELGYLRGVSDKGIHKVGTQTVHGVRATHYKADIDWNKAFPDAKQAAQAMAQMTGSHTMPVDVWLDEQGRVVQMKFTETVHPKAAQAGTVTMGITESLSDYGTPVHVTAPAKDRTTDMTSKFVSKLPAPSGGN